MKKVGKEVLTIACTATNLRNGESSMLRLRDGSILHAYTHYGHESCDDDADAVLWGCVSADEGETWSEFHELFPKDKNEKNNMSVSLLRLADGALGVVYCRKSVDEEGRLLCMPVFRRSEDEGKTWSDFCFCTEQAGYYCTVNDTAIVRKNGKLLVASARSGDGYRELPGTIRFFASDDNGLTWYDLPAEVTAPYEEAVGLQEPGVFEHEDGTLWLFCRTAFGHQYQSFSADGGLTWSQAMPNFFFTSPDSPMRVKKTGELVTAVFNPMGYSCTNPNTELWGSPKRTPLVCTVTDEDGKPMHKPAQSFANGAFKYLQERTYLIEPEGIDSACYPAILGVKDGFLVSYYHSGGTEMCLHDTKIVKVYDSELR